MRDWFDRVLVINLQRRPDRWEDLQRHLAAIDWPFREPERIEAVDGEATGYPGWWQQGAGAWGCLMSHARVLEQALASDAQSVLVLEDDVCFTDDFGVRVERFLEAVPEEWDQLYLGGQHLIDPEPVGEALYRARDVNRTHAYAVHRRFMGTMYRHILHAPDYQRHRGHHVDHRLGALHQKGRHAIYTPRRWLAGQRGGPSDISGKLEEAWFWNTWAAVDTMPFVVVLGLHDGRANEIAAELATLGVHFGLHLGGRRYPPMEDAGIAAICESMFPFPETWRQHTRSELVERLRPWVHQIQREAADRGMIGGACYPQLCALHLELAEACGPLKVIELRGDDQRALASLVHRPGAPDAGTCRRVQEHLQRERSHWAREDRLVVDVAELDRDRSALRHRLARFIGSSPARPDGSEGEPVAWGAQAPIVACEARAEGTDCRPMHDGRP